MVQAYAGAPRTPSFRLLSHMGRVDESVGGLRPSRRIAGKNRRGLMAKLIDRERASERVAILGGDGFGDRESIHLNVLKCSLPGRRMGAGENAPQAGCRHEEDRRFRPAFSGGAMKIAKTSIALLVLQLALVLSIAGKRSEERRVGKEGRS